jgi:lipopolysaccharide transport system permease protein
MTTLSTCGQALAGPVRLLYRHRALTLELAKREITDRYVAQFLGVLWAVGHPLILVGVYVFIFRYVFNVQLGGTEDMPLSYTAYLLAGLFPWIVFQEVLAKGAVTIVSNTSLVKQVVFPIEVLPVKGVLAALLTQVIGTLCLLAYVLYSSGGLPWTYALLPVLWAAQILAMCGASFLLAAVGAYFRDLKDLVQVFCVVGVYIMPITYLPQMVPGKVRPLLYLNPFSYMTWCYQDACYFGRLTDPWVWLAYLGGSVLVFYVGFKVFAKLKVCFGNVL